QLLEFRAREKVENLLENAAEWSHRRVSPFLFCVAHIQFTGAPATFFVTLIWTGLIADCRLQMMEMAMLRGHQH
ncbi:MAG TPA: hypothetical protein VMT00_03230, partial [Thermoanaerobaculia bacterium]|nr:hypothetical protein [Thermoanaerobaculia bacterium]